MGTLGESGARFLFKINMEIRTVYPEDRGEEFAEIEPNYLIMQLTEGHYGEQGSVFNVHSLGYADCCEQFNEQFDTPWFSETYGIIPDDSIKLMSLDDDGNLICELTENEFGIISPEFWSRDDRFMEELTDSYAYRLGFLNGIEEFDGEVENEKLMVMLIVEPIVLNKPFGHYGYFEKLSTIKKSKNNLMEKLDNDSFNSI